MAVKPRIRKTFKILFLQDLITEIGALQMTRKPLSEAQVLTRLRARSRTPLREWRRSELDELAQSQSASGNQPARTVTIRSTGGGGGGYY